MKTSLTATALLIAASPVASAALVGYDDVAAFAAAASNPITVDFTGGPADGTSIEVSQADGGQQDFAGADIAYSPIPFANFTLNVGGTNNVDDTAYVDLPDLRLILEDGSAGGHTSYTFSFDTAFTSFFGEWESVNGPTLLTAGNDSLDLATFNTEAADSFFGFISDTPVTEFTLTLGEGDFERLFLAPGVIPEPASAALLAAGGALLLTRRRVG